MAFSYKLPNARKLISACKLVYLDLRASVTYKNRLVPKSPLVAQAMDVGLSDSLRGLQVEIDEVVKGSQRPGPFRQ